VRRRAPGSDWPIEACASSRRRIATGRARRCDARLALFPPVGAAPAVHRRGLGRTRQAVAGGNGARPQLAVVQGERLYATEDSAAGTKKVRRKEKKNVAHGHAHIKSTFNNTIVSITDP